MVCLFYHDGECNVTGSASVMQGVKIMSMAKKLSSESSRCKLHHKIRHGLLACDEILGMWYSKWSTLYGEVFYNSLS